ncbi:MAG: ankyrin repeat domain-containing protein [Pseudomonadota bacterium]
MGQTQVTIDSVSSVGDTPLHIMVWRQDAYAVQRLIEEGANVNALGDMSETPLHIAVRKGDAGVVEALLAAGADIKKVSEFGVSSQDLADEASPEVRRLFRHR